MQAEAKLVKMILESHGFQQTDSNDWNILWTCTGTSSKAYIYESLNECQKINHFVNSTELTRKDRLCYNIGKMQQKFGRNYFDFIPETYILPDEFTEFYKSFNAKSKEEKNLWIVKPSCSSQGKGIFMIDNISEVPLNESLVISKYIENPLLINGLKFDLRLYVLVTSVEPLRIYIYNEGLVRFASEPYNLLTVKQNVYAHLTNYSINKKSDNFIQNKNIKERDVGNKWSLSALQIHMKRMGINMEIVWDRIYDSIIKSIIGVEHHLFGALKKMPTTNNNTVRSNSFDLFGFDIILDNDLKPWILEVNLSPSLAFDSPLDYYLKSNLIVDSLNLVGIRKFIRRREALGKQLKVKQQSISTSISKGDRKKRYPSALNISKEFQTSAILNKTETLPSGNMFEGMEINQLEKLCKVSAKHREIMRDTLEELHRNQKHNFTRIYPVQGCNFYDQYFEQPRHINKMVYKFLYQYSEISEILMKMSAFKVQTNQEFTESTQQQQESQQFQVDQSTKVMQPRKSMAETTTLIPFQKEKKLSQNATFSKTESNQKNRSSSFSSMKHDQPDSKQSNAILKTQIITPRNEPSTESSDQKNISSKEERVVITGDDILIEYVKRLMKSIKQCPGELPSLLTKRIEQFLTHKVWSSSKTYTQGSKLEQGLQLWQKLEARQQEMQLRKKRIFMKSLENNDQKYESKFDYIENQKTEIVKGFTSTELESMLLQSNQNNQLEVVGILVNSIDGGGGVLTKVERENRKLIKQQLAHKPLNLQNSFIQDSNSEFVTPKSNSFVSKVQTESKLQSYNSQVIGNENNSQTKLQTIKTKVSPYFTSQTSSKTNLHISKSTSKKTSTISEREFSLNTNGSLDNKLILPQIKNGHQQQLGSDFSRSSIQFSENDGHNKFRSRVGNDQYLCAKVNNYENLKKSSTHSFKPFKD